MGMVEEIVPLTDVLNDEMLLFSPDNEQALFVLERKWVAKRSSNLLRRLIITMYFALKHNIWYNGADAEYHIFIKNLLMLVDELHSRSIKDDVIFDGIDKSFVDMYAEISNQRNDLTVIETSKQPERLHQIYDAM